MDKKTYLSQIEHVIKTGTYQDNWDSLSHYQVPDWYQGLKFGIFIHWGVKFSSMTHKKPMFCSVRRGAKFHSKLFYFYFSGFTGI